MNPQLDSGSVQRSCGKLQQAFEIQLETTELEHHNLQVTDYEYVEKVFKNLRHKLCRSKNNETFDLNTNVLLWGLFMSTTVKSAVHLGSEHQQNLIACRNTNSEGAQGDVRYHLATDRGKFIRNSELIYHDMISLLG